MKIFLQFFAFIGILWLLLLVSLPMLVSTSAGQKYALGLLKQKSGNTLNVESVAISWFGPQQLKNVSYHNEKKPLSLDSKDLEIDNSLLTLILPGTSTIKGRAKGLNAEINTGKKTKLRLIDTTASFLVEADLHHKKFSELELQLTGAQGKFSVYGVNSNGVLLLRKPLEATITTSSELGKQLLQHLFPFLKEVVNAEKPLNLRISPEGFSAPLTFSNKESFKNIDVSKLKIGQGMVDLGIISFKNSGPLAKVLNLLDSKNSNEIKFWFAPAYFNISDGIINLQRTDMLAMNNYPLAIWGKIDLPQEQLNMTLGISLKALTAFGPVAEISKAIGANMLLLPLKGSFTESEIDTNAIKTKLGLLAVKFLGGINKLIKEKSKSEPRDKAKRDDNIQEKATIPAPLTNPLPWEQKGSDRE